MKFLVMTRTGPFETDSLDEAVERVKAAIDACETYVSMDYVLPVSG